MRCTGIRRNIGMIVIAAVVVGMFSADVAAMTVSASASVAVMA